MHEHDFRSEEENFLRDFHHTSTFGATPLGGIDRQAGTEEHGQVRRWFVDRAEGAGMSTRIDAVGNVYATFEWNGPDAESIFVGSHLDSQPRGGRFDGTYGVIAALHSALELEKKVKSGELSPLFNLTVVDWFNEEGARFAPSIMGSSTMAGLMDLEKILATKDAGGVTVAEALEQTGFKGTDSPPAIAGYAEIHIEQGRRLEREGVPIGAVTQSWYTQKLLVKVIGEQSHTGATLMADRRDALVAAARIVLMTESVVDSFAPETIVTSIGSMRVEPNSPIVVPREVELVVDLRASKKEDVQRARAELLEGFDALAQERNVEIEAEDYDIRAIQRYPIEGVELVEKAAAESGVPSLRLETMAGHDSVAMNRIVPSVMMFVPSVDGVSHCEREFTPDDDLVGGLRVLTEVAQKLVLGELSDVSPGEPV